MRVGVLTGGGDCAGLNAVIRAVTKSLIHHGPAEVPGGVFIIVGGDPQGATFGLVGARRA